MLDKYGCHSDTTGPEPRGRTRKTWVQAGWRTTNLMLAGLVTREPIMVERETAWNPLDCGHLVEPERGPDVHCEGCVHV